MLLDNPDGITNPFRRFFYTPALPLCPLNAGGPHRVEGPPRNPCELAEPLQVVIGRPGSEGEQIFPPAPGAFQPVQIEP